MTYKEYISILNALKLANENRIIGIIPEMENFAYQALIDWMDASLSVRSGNLVASEETISILNQFDSSFLRVLNAFKPYNGAVSKFLKELPAISDHILSFQEVELNIGANQKLVVNEILKAYTDNGLNAEFVQPLRDLLYQNIAAGTNVKEAKGMLKDYVTGADGKDSKINKYLTQTSQQAVDGYAGMVNKKLMETFDYPYLQMSGSLIETSSPQCVKGINKYEGLIDADIWENELKPLAEKHGLIEGTTFKNLPFNKLHWGCRHEFTPTMVKI